jgi:hypothetical protein
LPNSPPKGKGEPVSVAKLLGLDAVALMKSPAFATFAIASFLICIPLAVYYSKANEYISAMNIQEMLGLGSETVMTFGQMSEIGFMLLMPLLLSRYGVKTMLLGGMLAWVARYVLFAYGGQSAWMLALLTYGAGMYVGNLVFPLVAGRLATTDAYPWQPFWLTFAIAAAVVMVGFALAFRDPVKLGTEENA